MRNVAVALILAFPLLSPLGASPSAAVAPDFNLRTPEGKRVNLAALLENGPVLLDFWATWCAPCVRAMPRLSGIHDDYSGKGFTVLGVNQDGPRGQARVRPFLRAHDIAFPVVLDLDGAVAQRMQVMALPTTLLVAPDGEVVYRQIGFGPADEVQLRRAIEGLLKPGDGE